MFYLNFYILTKLNNKQKKKISLKNKKNKKQKKKISIFVDLLLPC